MLKTLEILQINTINHEPVNVINPKKFIMIFQQSTKYMIWCQRLATNN